MTTIFNFMGNVDGFTVQPGFVGLIDGGVLTAIASG